MSEPKRFHISIHGEPVECHAEEGKCPRLHGATPEEAMQKFEESMQGSTVGAVKRTRKRKASEGDSSTGVSLGTDIEPKTDLVQTFDSEHFYGTQPPREVQLQALNGVIGALEEEDQTQLVAACGTGKTYMGRQILNHAMSQEDSNGIAVILTSSIKLAHDTVDDMRPHGGYDKAFGEYGEDYEVIEVHSDAKSYDGRQSVKKNGVVSAERIKEQMENALAKGKKVVIVSTYDSCGKVQEAQSLCADKDRVEADLIMHDEAHNILGQQKPTSVNEGDGASIAYTGFDNRIPGAIQSRKRLYATATPVIRETPEDKESTGSVDAAIAVAADMQKGGAANQKKRVTFYSNDEAIVGSISGYISQQEAIDTDCLAKPEYQIRSSSIKGNIEDYRDPVVNSSGELIERSQSTDSHPLSPVTYSAVDSTLNAMVADSEPGTNPSTNVLAYTGSIDQSEAFRDSIKKVAFRKSGAISLDEASANVNSDDPEMRKRARMRLLAEHLEVKAAHSRSDAKSKEEREAAFSMFNGKSATDGNWTPHKRVLANVDIFSEGVNIPEIDTVVVTDDDKLSERAMTQAIGRSIRKVPGNSFKNTGHVIIPSVSDSSGRNLNESSVNMAAYGATRVERGVSTAMVQGRGISPDKTTRFRTFDSNGKETEPITASERSHRAVTSIDSLYSAYQVQSEHQKLMKEDAGYRNATASEQVQMMRSSIRERIDSPKTSDEDKRNLGMVSRHLEGFGSSEIRNLRRNAKVASAAISVGDVGSLHPDVANTFIRGGILKPANSKEKASIGISDKRESLSSVTAEAGYTLLTTYSGMSDDHKKAQALIPEKYRKDSKLKGELMRFATGRGPETLKVKEFRTEMDSLFSSNDQLVESSWSVITEKDEKKRAPILRNMKKSAEIREKAHALEESRHQKDMDKASQGEVQYVFNESMLKRDGSLTSRALKKLAQLEYGRALA